MRNATYMSKRGFTLIEVLTTIAIIGILVAITSMVYGSSLKRSRDGQRKTDLDSISNLLEQYYLDNREYVEFDRSNGEISSARWQLDNRNQFGNCKKIARVVTLVPLYGTSIPEDPINKVNINAQCPDLTRANLSNKYLYFAGKEADTDPRAGYYLLAKMETAPAVNIKDNDNDEDPFDKKNILFTLRDWGYSLDDLVLSNCINASCTQNYVVRQRANN